MEGLLILVIDLRVGDDAAAGPDIQPALLCQQGADGDAGVHPAMHADIADAAAVAIAPVRLELFDDLHGADLRRAGDRAARKAGAQQIQPVQSVSQLAGDGGDQMVDGRE